MSGEAQKKIGHIDQGWSPEWVAIDHVQIAMPVGGETEARSFFVGVFGMVEMPKPPSMAARGGCWFEAGGVRIHVGAEADFRPNRKAHPALLVRDLVGFIQRSDIAATWDDEIPGVVRCHIDDPWGNRIELIEAGRS